MVCNCVVFSQKIPAQNILETQYFQKLKKILKLKAIFPKRYFKKLFHNILQNKFYFGLSRYHKIFHKISDLYSPKYLRNFM